jgi:hypothetical protein
MSRIESICPICGKLVNRNSQFCPHCGSEFKQEKKESRVLGGFRSRLKSVGDTAQKLTEKTAALEIGTKSSEAVKVAKEKMSGNITSERASEVVGNLVEVMVHVARDLKEKTPPEVIKAIDLSAEVSFVAFSVGVSIDLEQLDSKTTIKT